MNLFIILFLFSSIFTYSDTRRIEGKIIIKDENNPEIIYGINDRPYLSVELKYYVNNNQLQSCGVPFNVGNKWRFAAEILDYCNSPNFYGKELYLIPDIDNSNLPNYWRLEEPPPHITLIENQFRYRKSIVILIPPPSKLSREDRIKNFETAKKVLKESPGTPEISSIYFWEAARGEGGKREFAKKGHDFLTANGQEILAKQLYHSLKERDAIYAKGDIDSIPTARNPWTVLSALPGLMVDRVDVGGADSGQQSTFYAGGGTSDDTTWNIDGANVTDPSAIGAAPAYLNINSYDELQVNLGSNDISAQTGGVQLNFVTKRAGNRTSGDFHLYLEDENWEIRQDPTQYMIDNGLIVPGILRLYRYGINLGGPIVKDKLWWFGSWAIQDIHKRTESAAEDATWLVSGYGKLNFQLGNTSGDFHISSNANQKWGRTAWSAAQQNNGSMWDQEGPNYLFYGGLSHVFGELMLNVKGVYTDGGFALDPRGADINPANGHNEGADMLITDWSRIDNAIDHYMTNRNSINVSFDGNYFLEGALGGDHEIRFGVDYFTADTTSQDLYPNQRYLVTYTGFPQYNYITIFSDYKTDVNFERISAYIQNTITWGKLTASFGLRYDKESGGVNPLTQPAFTWYEPDSPHHGEQLWPEWNKPIEISEPFKPDAAWSLLSPRISLTYDITGDGKNVVKLSAARYMGQSGNTIGVAYAPFRRGIIGWNDANLDNQVTYNELGPVYVNSAFLSQDPNTGLNNIQWAPDYNTPLLDELVLKFEKALTDDLAIALSGFYKKRHNLSIDYGSRVRFGSVTKTIKTNGEIEGKENWVMIGNTTVAGTQVPTWEQVDTGIGSYYYNKDKAYDTYLGLQFLMTKNLSNKWMANLSFTWQDWKRYRFEDEELDLNNFDFYNEGVMTESTSGSGLSDIFVNSRWIVKLTGMYRLPWEVNLTTFFQAREGNPQPLRSQIRLNQGPQRLYQGGTKLGDQRLPTFWMLNLGLEKTIKITDTLTATLAINWYNATNNQIELKRNLYVGEEIDPGEPEPVMWTNPGLFQFGIRINL